LKSSSLIATWSNSIPWHPRRISPCGQRHAIEQQVLAPDIDREGPLAQNDLTAQVQQDDGETFR
jgi:hypothetical protein